MLYYICYFTEELKMPAKSSFTKDMFIDAAFKIARSKGRDKLSARSLAKELNCSTMPIYSYLKSMKSLDKQLREKAIDILLNYQTTPRTGQAFFDMGLGYVLFAKQEKNLFRYLFAGSERGGRHSSSGKVLKALAFKNLVPKMRSDPFLEALDEQRLESILTKMWIFVHGLAFLINNNAFAKDDDNYIKELLKETGLSVIAGEKAKMQSGS
jgi:AcrR family transcriptional regulator